MVHVHRGESTQPNRTVRFSLSPQSRAGVRAEAILTELVFEHSLCIRVKSEPAAKGPGQGRNLLGRLNNMITTDIRLVIGSKRLLLSLVYLPLMLILSIWFLYSVLGWR